MMARPTSSRRLLLGPVVLALTVALAACGQSGSADAQEAGGQLGVAPSGGAAEPQPAVDGGGTRDEAQTEPEGFAAPIEQQIVKTGEATVEVGDVPAATGRVRAMALDLGGYVGSSQAGAGDDVATLVLRIPAPRFDDALVALRDLDGEVVAEATRESDVTRQIVDLEARIANLEASEASYRVLVERAERIEDILAVQTRLDAVRGEIEQLQAQLQDIEGQADLSTLTVTLLPVAEPVAQTTEAWDPGEQAQAALATLVGIGQGFVAILIWVGIVWLPAILVLGVVLLVAYRAVLEVRRRMPPPAPRESS